MTAKEMLSAEDIDRLADEGEVDMTQFMKPGTLRMPNAEKKRFPQRKITISVPEWAIDAAEERAEFVGTTRAAVVNTWIAQMAVESKRELAAM